MTNQLEKIVENIEIKDSSGSAHYQTAKNEQRNSVAYRAGVNTGKLMGHVVRYAKRYGIAELAATAASTITAKTVYDSTKSESAAALASNLAGYASFFGVIASQEINSQRKLVTEDGRKFSLRDAYTVALNLVKEFGVSTYIDLCLTRPLILKESIKAFGAAKGGFIGKWIADIPFWIMSDISRNYGPKIKDRIRNYFHKMKGGNEK